MALHNVSMSRPVIAKYLINTYRYPSRLVIAEGKSIYSMEGTTQGDPLAMPWYSLSTVAIIEHLMQILPSVKQVWLAADASAAGDLKSLFEWYEKLTCVGSGFGYLVNKSKSWLIVKSAEMEEKAISIFGNQVNITKEGQCH